MYDDLPTFDENKLFYEKTPFTEINQIQPHGCLIVLNQDLIIQQCSSNIEKILKTPIEELLNQPVTTFLKLEKNEENLKSWLAHEGNKYKQMYWQSSKKNLSIWVFAHISSKEIIIEIEPNIVKKDENDKAVTFLQYTISNLQLTQKSLPQILQKTCEEIQKATDFDRVLIYRFNEYDQSGVVINESLKKGILSYYGLSFPENLIPKTIPKVYLQFPLQYTPALHKKPVSIVPEINPLSQNYVDLSNTNLFSLPPYMIQYITELGLKSIITIAIIHDKKLWGLIACQHQDTKYLSIRFRLILMNAANSIAAKITKIENKKFYFEHETNKELQASLTNDFNKADSLNHALESHHTQLTQLVLATGMSIYFSGDLLNFGRTPTNDELTYLIAWLQTSQLSKPYATSSLPKRFSASQYYKDKACGLLAIPITAFQNHCLLFYRAEVTHTISWAGEAEKPHHANEPTRDLPHNFLETISDNSSPWTDNEIKSLDFIRSLISNKKLQDLLQLERFNERQQFKNRVSVARLAGRAEVANSVLHNVGNVLNSINVSASMIGDKIKNSKISNVTKLAMLVQKNKKNIGPFIAETQQGQYIPKYLQILSEAWEHDKKYLINEVNGLNKNLQHIKKIIAKQQSFSGQFPSSEEVIIAKVIDDSLIAHKAIYEKENIQIIYKYKLLKVVTLDQVKLQQVLINLIKNCIDSLLECNPEHKKITFYLRQKNDTNFQIKVSDNGLGVLPENLTKIFSFGFTTKKGGHGFGLHASAMTIVEMGGTIFIKSKGIRQGATFIIILPNNS